MIKSRNGSVNKRQIVAAMEAFPNGALEQAKESFLKAYHIAKPNDLLMPFAEYGEQIQNLTGYMANQSDDIDPSWICCVMELARQYKKI